MRKGGTITRAAIIGTTTMEDAAAEEVVIMAVAGSMKSAWST